jgi:hypothetical protein
MLLTQARCSFFGNRAPVDYIGGIMNIVPWVVQKEVIREQLGAASRSAG